MINMNVTDNYFDYVKKHSEYKVVVYGAGNMTRKNYKFMGHIDFFCDQNAKNIGKIGNISCLMPEELKKFNDRIIILICIKNKKVVFEVCSMMEKQHINAEIFSFFQNPAFSQFDDSEYIYEVNPKNKLKINIVYNDDGWILGKFAQKLQEELNKLGYEVSITEEEDKLADINHYIYYGDLTEFFDKPNAVRTVMITHIDSVVKKDLIRYQTQNGVVGICMSSDTANKLTMWGIPGNQLCYVNPAQDGEITPRKIVLGVTNRCYHQNDFRKRDDIIIEISRKIDPCYFKWKIMGSGWDKIVEKIKEMGFEVDYYEEFDKEIYKKLMPSLDYWLYYGFDEGAMGFLDALAAGVKTIATPQGYHLDAKGGLTHPCSTIEDFIRVLKRIQAEKKEIADTVKDWTWQNYARKHLEIWHYLTHTKPLKDLYAHQSEYTDGIFSLLMSNTSAR